MRMEQSRDDIAMSFPRLERQDSHPRSGCLAKLPALDLRDLLGTAYKVVFGPDAPNPMAAPEDSALINCDGGQLLVTTDLIPMVGVDPYIAGRIAALHSMSDIYACGGVPNWALVTMIVKQGHSAEFNQAVMVGILQACFEAHARVCGGQTIIGTEAMSGLTVFGNVSRQPAMGKLGAVVGDRLLLSKPLGVGLILRAHRSAVVAESDFEEAILSMTTSNRIASEAAVKAQVHAATDVTGFGFLGHLGEMLQPGMGVKLNVSAIPTLRSLAGLPKEFLEQQTFWTQSNLKYIKSRMQLSGLNDNVRMLPLVDPQTNGGLLVAASPESASQLVTDGYVDIGHFTNSDSVELGD